MHVNPAQAMGTFLKTWRSEWAGMSRRQLAIAVSALLNSSKTVSPTIIREWEEGQPPKTTEEFEALCQVTGRNGLTDREVGQFRHSVFLGCAGRQYPELFHGADFAYRGDVDEAAQAAHAGYCQSNLIGIVASAVALKRALDGRDAVRTSHRQTRKQQVALAYLGAELAMHHFNAGRHLPRARTARANGRFLAEHFGPRGLGADLSVPWAQWCEIQALRSLRRRSGGLSEEQEAHECRQALALHDRALEEGDERVAQYTFHDAICKVGALTESEAADRLAQGEMLLGSVVTDRGSFQMCLCNGYLRAGRIAEAEQHLLAMESWKHSFPLESSVWHHRAGLLALAQGNPGEGEAYLQSALRLAVAGGHEWSAQWVRASLRAYEQKRPRAGRGASPRGNKR